MTPRKVDVNQPAIVAGLRQCGARVQHLHEIGQGVPDLLVGFRGALYLLEIKAPGRPALTPDETAWHAAWQGYPVHVCATLDEALRAIGAFSGPDDQATWYANARKDWKGEW